MTMAGDRPAALVTGSASGIGRAAALRLARAGYDVAINSRRSEYRARSTLAELTTLGGRHLALRGDVSDEAAVAALTATVGEAYGRLDVLVNNAGMTSSTPPEDLNGVDLAEWDRVFAVNVRGLFQVTRACAGLLRNAGGSVVNVASIVGLRPGPQRTLGESYDRLMDRRATWTPMKRNVTVDDVAETIYSLIASNPFVTGETIVIDGGYAATT